MEISLKSLSIEVSRSLKREINLAMNLNDDDEDLGAFSFLASGKELVIDEDPQGTQDDVTEEPYISCSSICKNVDRFLLLRDTESLLNLHKLATNVDSAESDVIEMALQVLQGNHINLLSCCTNPASALSTLKHQLLSACLLEMDVVDTMRRITLEFIEKGGSLLEKECRALQCLILAAGFLEIFCQSNYTGPELSPASISQLFIDPDDSQTRNLHSHAVRVLECDGEWVYTMCELPHTLLLSRAIMLALAAPTRASWEHGISLSIDGVVSAADSKIKFTKRYPKACRCAASLDSLMWRSARVTTIHARLLPNLTYDKIPTLWKECTDYFSAAGVGVARMLGTDVSLRGGRMLLSQLSLERGLCQHHFNFDDKGKKAFGVAQKEAGLYVHLTGAMGKRTKYQIEEHAQMLLVARSSLTRHTLDSLATSSQSAIQHVHSQSDDTATSADVSSTAECRQGTLDAASSGDVAASASTPASGWQHAEWEMGRRLVAETDTGEEAAVREVLLDSMDGGAAVNIFLEGGPKFSDPTLDKGGELHPVDQAVILALCLDVGNSNPDDGLTGEVMMPYLTRVLELANNWMIHSTALLERSWLEYHQQRMADRAMLQIQALLDQHTTKLTIMQSTYKSIHEDSAPAQDRLHYIHCIVYPAQYELKKDLANRYLRSSVVVSALGLFKELELWDDVVTCYQLMEKPHRAEMVVREQLKTAETPYMLTALADLTGNENLYEKAWTLSRRRYGRAKRTLAKICYDREDHRACIGHLEEALSIHPLMPNAWYLKGLASMRLETYDEALHAFTRCVQQDMEIGEAWANCGAIHMKRRQHQQAYASLTEALRHKRESWQVIENLMICCLVLTKWREAAMHMNKLLDLRGKSNRPVHKEELRHLALMVSTKARQAYDDVRKSHSADLDSASQGDLEGSITSNGEPILAEDGNEEISDASLPDVAKLVEKLLLRMTNTLPSDADLWDILAAFQSFLGRRALVVDCRVKQFRTLINEPNWEKEKTSVAEMMQAAKKLIDAHEVMFGQRNTKAADDSSDGVKGGSRGKADMYACKSLLLSAQRKLDVVFAELDESKEFKLLMDEFDELYRFVEGR